MFQTERKSIMEDTEDYTDSKNNIKDHLEPGQIRNDLEGSIFTTEMVSHHYITHTCVSYDEMR